MSIIRRIQGFFIALSLFFTGSVPFMALDTVKMPEMNEGEYSQWVNPFIGTGATFPWATAMLSPAATAPFGAVRLGPDTCAVGGIFLFKTNTSGYYYNHNYIRGFSQSRLSGTGIYDLGTVRVTPALSDTDPADRANNPLPYSHKYEEASAGYYAVYLPSVKCMAEMTATDHVGVHRYTFNTDDDAHLFMDATSFIGDTDAREAKLNVLYDSNEIVGESVSYTGFTSRYGGLKTYFVARFDTPIKTFASWIDSESVEGRKQVEGDDIGVNVGFGSIENKPVTVKVGISYVSAENARENLEAEVGELDFDGVYDKTTESWESRLSSIEAESDDSETMTNFYTAMYHCMIMPTNFTDSNGEYLGFDKKVHTAEGYTYRTDMSLWDTFRSTHPLYTLIAPDVQLDCINSLVEMAKAGGSLPRWPSGAGYTGSMFGTPSDMLITEAYLKGLTDFDVEAAYNYMKKTSEQAVSGADYRKGINEYNQYGYCPADLVGKNSVSFTLEYAWADYSISLLANALGKQDEADYYYNKSQNYKNTYNPETKYFQARNSDGSWVEPLLPNWTSFYDDIFSLDFSAPYCEGSARQWRWSVPQDTTGMIELFGGKDYFVSELEEFMQDASKSRAALDPGAGYWHGNQHDMHAAYLFDDAGHPELTQKWVRWIMTDRYGNCSDGLDGNDDGGTLSAWYILSSIGFYAVAGTDRYWIGAPIVDKATVSLGEGKALTVIAENQSAENMYVQSVTLNGVKLTSPSLLHSQIAGGGTLVFTMGSSPAENGGF